MWEGKQTQKGSMGVTLLPLPEGASCGVTIPPGRGGGCPGGWCRIGTRKASRTDQAIRGAMAEQRARGAIGAGLRLERLAGLTLERPAVLG